jgi:hypothetical protein
MIRVSAKTRAGTLSAARRWLPAGAALLVGLPLAAGASTIATFDWVQTSSTTSDPTPVTPSGVLTLTLPSTITAQTFNTGNLGSAAAADITGFSYTFSDSLHVGLSNLTSRTISGNDWQTSNLVTPAGASSGIYLISGFNLSGSEVFPGDPRAASFQIANSAGLPSLVAQDSNSITPFAGQGAASNDAGYWELKSFQTPVPVPAAA